MLLEVVFDPSQSLCVFSLMFRGLFIGIKRTLGALEIPEKMEVSLLV
jgi:hypothetical protein